MTNREKATEISEEYENWWAMEAPDVSGASFESAMAMAEWKDEQHSVVYVVTRSDMHYDEVEKVFFDIKKAEQYCAGYNNNENEYRRNITEIDVTL